MKKVFALLLLSAIAALPAQASLRHGGNQVNSKTVLVGVNAAGLESGSACPGSSPADYAVPTAAEFDYYRSKNWMVVRLPFKGCRAMQTQGGALDPTYMGYIQAAAGFAAQRGMCVILDDHDFGSWHGNKLGAGVFGPTDFAFMWGEIVTAAKAFPLINGTNGVCGYELMNEPADVLGTTTWFNSAQAAITTIRGVDPTTPIYVDGEGYASAYGWPNNTNLNGGWGDHLNDGTGGNYNLKNLAGSHIVMTAHSYADWNNSGSYPTYASSISYDSSNKNCDPAGTSYDCAVTMGDVLDSPPTAIDGNTLVKRYSTYFVPWCEQNHLTCAITETGISNDDPRWIKPVLENGIQYLQDHNILLTYWAAGGNFVGYNLGVEPQTSGGDTVQVAGLTKWTGATQPTTYYSIGPERGTAGSASTAFMVTYKGYHKQDIKVTPKAYDSVTTKSSGGTLSPSSITIPAGYNGTGQFTYSSSGTASFAVGVTDNLGFTPPAAIGYATVSDQFLASSAVTVNICSLQKAYAPYIGPLVNLRRSVDNATKDFYPVASTVGSLVDTAAITKWAGGSNTYMNTCYGQGPNGNNFYPIDVQKVGGSGSDTYSPSASTTDEPLFLTNCGDGKPCFDDSAGGRVNAVSPVPSATQQSVFAVMYPTSTSDDFVGWDWSGTINNDIWVNDDININGASSIRAYTSTGLWTALGSTWTSGGLVAAIRDGTQLNSGSGGSSTISLPFSRSNLNLGFHRFSGQTYSGKWREIAVMSNAIDGAAFTANQDSRWGITPYGSTMYAPTLQQNTGSGNAPLWAGVNIAGSAAGGGFSNITCSPGINGGGKCPWNKAVTPGTGAYYASRGMNLVRLLVSWPALQQNLCTGDTTIDATQLANVDAAVNEFTAAGIDVLIDLHAYGVYNYSTWTTCASPPDAGNIVNTTTGGYFINFWTQMGTHYASNPKVYFDLTNEPNGQAAATQAPVFQSAINGARGAGFHNYIFTEWGSGFAKCDDVATSTGAAFLTLTDSDSKLVLECHRYINSCNNDQCGEGSSQGRMDLTSATTYCAANGCHLFWGEFNATFNPQMYTELKADFDLLAANPTVWYGWSEYAGGPAWTESYIGLVEPHSYTVPYVDRPQMKLLNTYATGHTWRCKGGGTGTAGVCPGTWPDAQFP